MNRHLIAEVGGTNIRFALCRSLSAPVLGDITVIPSSRFKSIDEAIIWYLSETSTNDIESACLAIAGPATGPEYKLTNSNWSFDISSIQQIIGTKNVKVVNDHAALAACVPHLVASQLVSIRDGRVETNGSKLILGPGTGMGMATLASVGEHWQVLPSEGGNVGFAPNTPLEFEILKVLSKRQGRVVIEDLLCGDGLVLLYTTLCVIRDCKAQARSAAQITDLALAGSDSMCTEVVDIFCGILGEYAGDMALVVSASGGVYLGGGILPRITSILSASTFCDRFSCKRKVPQFVADIPVWLITTENPALTGACYLLRESYSNNLDQ